MSEQKYLTTRELARRWGMSPETLKSWRQRDQGPRYFKPGGPNGKVLYAIEDIEAWEEEFTA